MKIAFIGQKGIPAHSGGVESHVEQLAIRLAKQGNEVYVYTRPNYTDKNLAEYQGVNLISLPSIPTKHLDAISHTFLACLDSAFRRKVDLIHFHSIGPSSLIWLAKVLNPRTPILFTFHSKCYLHKKWGFFARFYLYLSEFLACKFSDKTITISQELYNYVKSRYGIKSVFIPNGFKDPQKRKPHEIQKWGLGGNDYILYVSRLMEIKGAHHLIRAFQNINTKKKLVIVGEAAAGEERYAQRLRKIAREKKEQSIIFTGSQSGKILAELFSNAYLFVLPSEIEGLSVALLEAMSYGLPVLTSDIPENREALGNTGFTFKNKNQKDLEAKLKYLLANPGLARKSAREGERRAFMCYNWNKIADETLSFYKGLLTGRQAGEPHLKRAKQSEIF